MYRDLFSAKPLKNTEWDFLYRVAKDQFWHGGRAGRNALELGIERFRKGNLYDFGIISLPKEVFVDDCPYSCLYDLILPYLSHYKPMVSEGLYEEYGVQVLPGDIVIDAGANIGTFTAFAAKYRHGIVHAFEPVAKTADLLRLTVDTNEINDSVVINQMALGNQVCDAEIALVNGAIGSSTFVAELQQSSMQHEKVHITTLDEYVRQKQLSRVDFIKADIEGSERGMLEGATETLRRFKPKLAICTYHLPDDPDVLAYIIKKANPEYHIEFGAEKLYAK